MLTGSFSYSTLPERAVQFWNCRYPPEDADGGYYMNFVAPFEIHSLRHAFSEIDQAVDNTCGVVLDSPALNDLRMIKERDDHLDRSTHLSYHVPHPSDLIDFQAGIIMGVSVYTCDEMLGGNGIVYGMKGSIIACYGIYIQR